MAFTQLTPCLPVEVRDRSKGVAIAVIDYSEHEHLIWVCVMDATGEIWSVRNPEVRARSNPTFGRGEPVWGDG